MTNPIKHFIEKQTEKNENEEQIQHRRIEKLEELNQQLEDSKGFHVPHPIQKIRIKKDIHRLKEEIEQYEATKKSKRNNLEKGIVLVGSCFVIILAGIALANSGNSRESDYLESDVVSAEYEPTDESENTNETVVAAVEESKPIDQNTEIEQIPASENDDFAVSDMDDKADADIDNEADNEVAVSENRDFPNETETDGAEQEEEASEQEINIRNTDIETQTEAETGDENDTEDNNPPTTDSGTESKTSSGGGNSNFNAHNNPELQNTTDAYVLNTSKKKIHLPSCDSVKKMAEKNYATTNESLEELMARGYSTCGQCLKNK